MRGTLKIALLAFAAVGALAQAASEPHSRLPPAREIRSVWDLSIQPCNGGGANAYTRNTSEAEVKLSKQLDMPKLGYRFSIPQLPDTQETVVKVHLNDHSRGVTDHYLLLANQDLEAPFAAIVITELPKGMETRESAFQAARTLQEGLARPVGLSVSLQEIDGPYGKSLEMLVPNRVGTHCYPTSGLATVPPGAAVETIGISRFAFDKNRLIEFSLILKVEPQMPLEKRKAFARAVMDGFWRSLTAI
jgi:hypothetical protein